MATRDPREKVYESPHGFVGIRAMMESLIPGHTHPSRFFMPCSLMKNIAFKKTDQINSRFVEKIRTYLDKFPRVKNLRTTNLVLFPILRKEHYFLIVFDLVKEKMQIIDNDMITGGIPSKYRVFLDNLSNEDGKV